MIGENYNKVLSSDIRNLLIEELQKTSWRKYSWLSYQLRSLNTLLAIGVGARGLINIGLRKIYE